MPKMGRPIDLELTMVGGYGQEKRSRMGSFSLTFIWMSSGCVFE